MPHFSPGTNQENPTPHRLFLFWYMGIHTRRRPLTSNEVSLHAMAHATTATGLSVHGPPDRTPYPTGIVGHEDFGARTDGTRRLSAGVERAHPAPRRADAVWTPQDQGLRRASCGVGHLAQPRGALRPHGSTTCATSAEGS